MAAVSHHRAVVNYGHVKVHKVMVEQRHVKRCEFL